MTKSENNNGAKQSIELAKGQKASSYGPSIWLAGDPEDLKTWLPRGGAGIVTNTIVLNDMVKKYGQLKEVVQRYLDITDKKIAIEIDGHSTQELLDVGEVFVKMSPKQIILKIPATDYALEAFSELKTRGVETFCTTVFTLNQATAIAQAGASHILPFCEPYREIGGDPVKLVRECRSVFDRWENRPQITAALVRSVETAELCIREGADGIIVFWPIFQEMMKSKLTDEWNSIFLNQWNEMYNAKLMEGIPVKKH